jgi:hypothetical protein
MKKRIGVKRSLQHPQSSSSCVTSQEQFHKYNPDMIIYYDELCKNEKSIRKLYKELKHSMLYFNEYMGFISTPYMRHDLFNFKNLRIDKKGHVKKSRRKK